MFVEQIQFKQCVYVQRKIAPKGRSDTRKSPMSLHCVWKQGICKSSQAAKYTDWQPG